MAEELDTEAILHASELINSTLISKGYINENLLFPTINWDQLSASPIEINESVYNNDKNLINIIYSLLQTIERNKSQKESFNKILQSNEINKTNLTKKIEKLNREILAKDEHLKTLDKVDKSKVSRIQSLEQANKESNISLNKYKNLNKDLKVKYEIEIRKKDIQISNLKDKLSKNSMTTIYNNNSIITQKPIMNTQEILNKEFEKILVDLTNLINNLIVENSKFLKFNKKLIRFFTIQNKNIQTTKTFTNPVEILDIEDEITKNQNINELINEIESFDSIFEHLTTIMNKNYGLINTLVINDNNSSKLASLEKELKKVKQNWHKAIKTMENWKSYKNTTNGAINEFEDSGSESRNS